MSDFISVLGRNNCSTSWARCSSSKGLPLLSSGSRDDENLPAQDRLPETVPGAGCRPAAACTIPPEPPSHLCYVILSATASSYRSGRAVLCWDNSATVARRLGPSIAIRWTLGSWMDARLEDVRLLFVPGLRVSTTPQSARITRATYTTLASAVGPRRGSSPSRRRRTKHSRAGAQLDIDWTLRHRALSARAHAVLSFRCRTRRGLSVRLAGADSTPVARPSGLCLRAAHDELNDRMRPVNCCAAIPSCNERDVRTAYLWVQCIPASDRG